MVHPILPARTNIESSKEDGCSMARLPSSLQSRSRVGAVQLGCPPLCRLSFSIKNAGLSSDYTAQTQGHLRSLPLLRLCLKCSVGVNFWKKRGILKLSSSKLGYKSFMEIKDEKIHFFFIGLICLINALGTHGSINASNLLKLNYPPSMSWIKMT